MGSKDPKKQRIYRLSTGTGYPKEVMGMMSVKGHPRMWLLVKVGPKTYRVTGTRPV